MAYLSGVMSTVLSILAVAVGLGFVIFVHELGHFLVAKWVGVLVQRFSIGFGPILWSFRRGETEYAFSAIPFGGYVKMLGQDDTRPSEMVNEELLNDPRSYPAQSVPKRMAIISAGVVMNIVFGFLFFILVFNLGVPYTPAVIGEVEPGSPAWKAGLQRNDRIVQVNGEDMIEFEWFRQAILLSDPSERMTLKVAREDELLTFQVLPRRGRYGPELGAGASWGLTLDRKSPVARGSAADIQQGAQFKGGDRITHVNGEPVRDYAMFADFLARHAGEVIRVGVQRASRKDEPNSETAEIELPPQRFRTLGLRFQMGPVTARQTGSPAEVAGLEVGDVIRSIAGSSSDLLPGQERREQAASQIQLIDGDSFDPLRLPDKLAGLAGRDVEIKVKRQEQGEQTKTLTVHPTGQAGWSTPPLSRRSPVPVPALGACYQLVPAITEDPDPESPAGRVQLVRVSGGSPTDGSDPASPEARSRLRKGDRICKAILFEPSDSGDKTVRQEIVVDDDNPALPGVFWALQLSPQAQLGLEVKRGRDETWRTETPISPQCDDADPHWYAPVRGLNLTPQSDRLEPKGLIGSIGLGWTTTKNTLASVYLSLRRLVIDRTLSAKTLAGPISIALYGYHVSTDLTLMLKYLAILSINLAVINFLPIPLLDGGHMVFLTWEWIRGKPASERMIVAASYVGLVLILTLAVLVTWQDIRNLIN
ncbi:MAG: RIP metalloprotease RseP [Planctomycetes bacterium]|nr:RIP metalloprotease RseP [Planctomycetota bacterium]